jgi:hypothetical protein
VRPSRSRVRSSLRLGRWIAGARELPALILTAIWLAGVVIAPIVHLAQHARLAPHAHVRVAADVACHDGHCHDSQGVERRATDDEAPTDHGRGSPLHGDVAALFPAPPFVVPPFVAIGLRAVPETREDVTDPALAHAPWARGPPHAA